MFFFLVSEKYNKETTGIWIGVIIGVIVLVVLSVLGILYKRGTFRRCRRGNNYVSIHILPFHCENCNFDHGKSYKSMQFCVLKIKCAKIEMCPFSKLATKS